MKRRMCVCLMFLQIGSVIQALDSAGGLQSLKVIFFEGAVFVWLSQGLQRCLASALGGCPSEEEAWWRGRSAGSFCTTLSSCKWDCCVDCCLFCL